MNIDDQALITALKAGHASSFETLMARHTAELLAIARCVLRNNEDAEDALQDAFISAYRAIGSFRNGAPLRPWLSRIVRNAAIDKLRRRQFRREVPLDEVRLGVSRPHRQLAGLRSQSPQRALELRDEKAALRARVHDLPDSYRDVLLLRGVAELDTAECAEALGVSPGCAKVRLHRARRALRVLMAQSSAEGVRLEGGTPRRSANFRELRRSSVRLRVSSA